MVAIRAHFDGKSVVLPKQVKKGPACDVIVIFQGPVGQSSEQQAWLKAQEAAFRRVWDNDEDAVYDTL